MADSDDEFRTPKKRSHSLGHQRLDVIDLVDQLQADVVMASHAVGGTVGGQTGPSRSDEDGAQALDLSSNEVEADQRGDASMHARGQTTLLTPQSTPRGSSGSRCLLDIFRWLRITPFIV